MALRGRIAEGDDFRVRAAKHLREPATNDLTCGARDNATNPRVRVGEPDGLMGQHYRIVPKGGFHGWQGLNDSINRNARWAQSEVAARLHSVSLAVLGVHTRARPVEAILTRRV